jgi:hypothetical protein
MSTHIHINFGLYIPFSGFALLCNFCNYHGSEASNSIPSFFFFFFFPSFWGPLCILKSNEFRVWFMFIYIDECLSEARRKNKNYIKIGD